MNLDFFVPMKPQPLQRTRQGRNGIRFTPKESQDAKARIAYYAEQARNEAEIETPVDEDFYIEIIVFFAKPKCYYDGKPAFVGGDCDNHAKTVLDALQGVLYHNDNRVTQLEVWKKYGDSPGYRIMVDSYPIPEKPRKRKRRRKAA